MTLPLATNLSCFGLSARPLKRKTFTLSDSDHEQNQPVKRPRVELNLFSDNGRASSEDSSPHCDVDIENQLDDFSNSLADIKSKVSQAEAAHESTKKMVTEFQEKVASDRADVEKELKNAKQENKRVNIKLASALKQVRGVKKDRDELLMKWDSLSESVREAQELAREADQREVALRKDLLTSTEEVAIAQRQADIERRMARDTELELHEERQKNAAFLGRLSMYTMALYANRRNNDDVEQSIRDLTEAVEDENRARSRMAPEDIFAGGVDAQGQELWESAVVGTDL